MITEITYIGDGVQTDFNIPFEYAGPDVRVDVDDVTVTATIVGISTVQVTPAPADGSAVRVYRDTSINERAVDFSDGAVLTEEDLDKSATQAFRKLQELVSDLASFKSRAVAARTPGEDLVIPASGDRAGKFLGFNALSDMTAVSAVDAAAIVDPYITKVPGPPGPVDNAYLSLAAFKAQETSNKKATLKSSGSYFYKPGDWSGLDNDVTVIKADAENLNSGAWHLKPEFAVSIMEYIPEEEHAAILKGSSTYDVSPHVQKAIDENYAVYFPAGQFMFYSTIREASNNGARMIIGANRLWCKLKASPSLAASGAPIMWLGNSNGHGNYRLQFSGFYLDGSGNASTGAGGAIGLRPHECGTSYIGDLYIRYCSTAIDAVGCIGASFGGQKTEVLACEKGLWFTAPQGGSPPGSLGGDSVTDTESFLTLNDNINSISNIWFAGVAKPIRLTGGLTEVSRIVLQSCGKSLSDDLIHLIDANESFDYGAGPLIRSVWCEGGKYRSVIRVEHTRAATIEHCFLSGKGADTEQGIIVIGSPGTKVSDVSARGTWSAPLTEGRVGNHFLYVHGDSKNGVFGPNYYTQGSTTPHIEWPSATQNHIVIDNSTAGNNMKGITIGNIRIDGSVIEKNPDLEVAANWYLKDATSLNSFRSTGYVRADTEYRIGSDKVIGTRGAAIADPSGGATVDAEARAAIIAILEALRPTTGHGLISV